MRAIVSLSGGMDSATVLAEAQAQGRGVSAVGFRYGSKHNRYENQSALQLAMCYNVPFRLIDFTSVADHFKSDLLTSGGPIPEGHYADETMKRTVVPGRNLIFISILTGIAWSEDAGEIWLGIHSGDHAIYPDCRPEFFEAMKKAVELGSDGRVTLVAPFLNVDKGQILKRGLELCVPYYLTRTCYKDQPLACGCCGACVERLEAFRHNGVADSTLYEVKG